MTECAKTAEAAVVFPLCDRAATLLLLYYTRLVLGTSSSTPQITVRRELPHLIRDLEKRSRFRAFLEVLIRN